MQTEEKGERRGKKREAEWEGGAAKKALQLCATGERAVPPQPMLQLAANVAKKRGSAREWKGGGRQGEADSSVIMPDERSTQ